ncbi:hypothetical protein ES705_47923 [subsurface metagenome]
MYYENYLGLDYSEELITIAQKRYQDKSIKFISQNIKEFREYSNYDLIFGVGILHHVTDLNNTLKWLRKKSKEGTVFAFIEPQNGNPIIQILRRIRKFIDKGYFGDQVFFSKEQLRKMFQQAYFTVDKIVYIGYFSVPFAQVILKPKWLFMPISKFSVCLDKQIQKKIDSRTAWNMLILAKS